MLTPNHDHEIPAMTAEVARAAFPQGNRVMKRGNSNYKVCQYLAFSIVASIEVKLRLEAYLSDLDATTC